MTAARDRVRILLLTSGYPPVAGGAETYAAALAEGLAGRGHDVLVITDGVAEAPIRRANPEVRRLAGYRDLLADPSKMPWEQLYFGLLPELDSVLADRPVDLVIANNFETAVLGGMVSYQRGVPLVATFHEHEPEAEPFGDGKMWLAYRAAAPRLVLAGSRYYEARARRWLPPEQVQLIYHGVDADVFRPARDRSRFRDRYGVLPDDTLIVNVGRLKERKGQLDLLSAFAMVAGPTARLVVAGGVSSASLAYADRLETAAAEQSGRVLIDRSITPLDVPDLLAAADVVAQPSRSEGLGLSLLEAMSAGRPTVATRIPGFEEILAPADPSTRRDLVELVEPGDVAGLAGALDHLINSPSRRAVLSAAGRRHVLDHFSLVAMLSRTDRALQEVLERYRPAVAE